ncbi:hypothetical protein Ancab_022854, partial [Ancistrocladus abbreviatus]
MVTQKDFWAPIHIIAHYDIKQYSKPNIDIDHGSAKKRKAGWPSNIWPNSGLLRVWAKSGIWTWARPKMK